MMLKRRGIHRVSQWKARKPSTQGVDGSRSKSRHEPHQGSREIERRRKQIERQRARDESKH